MIQNIATNYYLTATKLVIQFNVMRKHMPDDKSGIKNGENSLRLWIYLMLSAV